MSKSKQINEDIMGIHRLMDYSRGLTSNENETLFESKLNKKKLVKEGPGVVLPVVATGLGIYGLWKWAVNSWGSKNASKRLKSSLVPGTWDKIAKSLKDTSIELGEDISGNLSVISKQEAQGHAETLESAMESDYSTDENKIARVLNSLKTFADLARVADAFGMKEYDFWIETDRRMSLYEWLDEELSQSYWETYVAQIMRSKSLIIYDQTEYETLKDFTDALGGLVSDKEAQPEKDKQNKLTIINAIKGKFGDCMTEALEAGTGGTDDSGASYIDVVFGDKQLRIYSNGRFMQNLNPKRMGTLAVCEVVTESWTFEKPFISEQFNIIYDSDKTETINIDPNTPTPVTPPVDVIDNKTPVKKRSGQKYVRVTYTFEDLLSGKATAKIGDVNKDEDGAIYKLQIAIGAKPDGVFGPNTKRAVEAFQRRKGLETTGLFGSVEGGKMPTNVATETDTEIETVPGGNEDPNAKDVSKQAVEVVKQEITTDSDASETLDYLKDVREAKLDETACIQLVVAANGALPNLVPEILPKLQACFYDFNFPRGIGRRAVKKRYGITGKGRKR